MSMRAQRYDSGKPILKTVDLGANGTAVSADQLGTIHQISAYHHEHGLVLAEPYSQFDGTRFYEPQYVRKYRARMLESIRAGRPGIGFAFTTDNQRPQIDFEGLGCVTIASRSGNGIDITTQIIVSEHSTVTQRCILVNKTPYGQRVKWRLDLGSSVNRASYGQLTEGGPIPLPRSRNSLVLMVDDGFFAIVNPFLGTRLEGCVGVKGKGLELTSRIQQSVLDDAPVVAQTGGETEIGAESTYDFTMVLRLGPISAAPVFALDAAYHTTSKSPVRRSTENLAHFIVRRNLEYILGNCAVPIPSDPSVTCLITDHVALPLGWNRDNYWQATFLLDAFRHLPKIWDDKSTQAYLHLIRKTIKGHLTWVFKCARRPLKYWARSYLITGSPKDKATFQLDQQCFGLLLLCDFSEQFPDEMEFIRDLAATDVIPEILTVLLQKQDSASGLYATEETPGDDAVEHPFHFSSQVLLWHTYTKLSRLNTVLGMEFGAGNPDLNYMASALKAATMEHFMLDSDSNHPGVFAYLVSGRGESRAYHDANDIPTLFASEWGFLSTSTELRAWRKTLEFAFSVANEGGYYDGGRYKGLGSVHTPGPWPLGYFQMWRFAQLVGDHDAEVEAWEKICGSMQWDGLFSEAVDVETGAATSKSWFCWPGAMIGSGLLQNGIRQRYL